MVNISKETNKRNSIETIIDSNKTMWFNEDNIEEKLNHKYLRMVTSKKIRNRIKKHRCRIVDESKKRAK